MRQVGGWGAPWSYIARINPLPQSLPRVGRPLLRSVCLRLWAVPLRMSLKCGLVCACIPSMPASGRGRGHQEQWSPLFRGSLLQRSGNLLSFQTLASPEVPREPSSPFLHSMHDSDRHRNSLVPHSLRGSAMCLCTTSTLQYLLTAIFSSFLSVFHFQTSNHRPFSFIVEHNHQEISQGEEKKNNKTNKQEPLFIGISKYTK